jgi:hypothetical protein
VIRLATALAIGQDGHAADARGPAARTLYRFTAGLPSLEEPVVPVMPVMPVVVIVVIMVVPVVPVSAADLCQLGRSQRLQLLLGQGQFLRFPCPH